MADSASPVKVTLQDETGKEIDSVTIYVPLEVGESASYNFPDQPPGKYTITITPLLGESVTGDNPLHYTLNEQGPISGGVRRISTGYSSGSGGGGNDSTGTSSDPPERPPPVPEIIAVTTISLALMGNMGLFEDFLLPRILEPTPPRAVQPSPGTQGRRLSPAVEAKLKQCLQENIKSLLGIPSLTELVQNLTEDEESLNTDFQLLVRSLYKQVQQLRKTITDCDPSLIRELLATEDNTDEQERDLFQDLFQNQSQNSCGATVIVTGELVNVRATPSLESEIIGQVLYGTWLAVDVEMFSYLSEEEKFAAIAGEGWYPVILPDGRRGYIYSRYLSSAL